MANDDEIKIAITADDKASGVLKDVGKSSGLLGGTLKALGAAAGVAALTGIAALTAAAISGAKSYEASEKRLASLDATLKSTGNAAGLFKQDILDQATALSKMTTFTKGAVIEADNLLLRFTNIKGPIFQQANQAIVNMATAMGTDLTEAAQTVGKALNAPETAMRLLRTSGIAFTDSQKEMIQTMVKSGDTMGAQKIILDELSKRFGGQAAAAAATFGGKIIQLENTLNAFKTALGKVIIEAITPFATKLLEFAQSPAFQNAINKIIAALGTFVNQVLAFVTNVLPVFLDKGKDLVAWFKNNELAAYALAAVITTSLIPAFVQMFTTLSTDLQQFLSSAILTDLEALINPWTLIGIAAVAAAYLIINNWSQVKQILADIVTGWNDLVNAFTSNAAINQFVQVLKADFEALWGTIVTQLWPAMQALWNTIQTQLWPAIQNLWAALQPLMPFFAEWGKVMLWMAGVVIVAAVTALTGLLILVTKLLQVFVEFVEFIVVKASTAITNFTTDVMAIAHAFEEVVNWIAEAINAIKNFSKSNVGSVISGISRGLGGGGGGSVNDAIIAPGGKIITTHPDDYLIATKNPAGLVGAGNGGVNINITGTFLSQDVAEQIGNKLIDLLKLNQRI